MTEEFNPSEFAVEDVDLNPFFAADEGLEEEEVAGDEEEEDEELPKDPTDAEADM